MGMYKTEFGSPSHLDSHQSVISNYPSPAFRHSYCSYVLFPVAHNTQEKALTLSCSQSTPHCSRLAYRLLFCAMFQDVPDIPDGLDVLDGLDALYALDTLDVVEALVALTVVRYQSINLFLRRFMEELQRAVKLGYVPLVKRLLRYCPASENGAILHSAVVHGHSALVELFLADRRFDVNATNEHGQTPLAVAVMYGHNAVARLLLKDDRVDVNTFDNHGDTPDWTRLKRDILLSKLLRSKSAKSRLPMDPATIESWNRCVLPSSGPLDPWDVPSEALTFTALMWAIMQFLSLLARRLQTMLQSAPNLDRFSEFPNRRRPPCTTMPWNVWPALVILWGVCWMFYSPPRTPPASAALQPGLPSSYSDTFLSGKTFQSLFSSEPTANRCVLKHSMICNGIFR
jgi:hypothetical protein